MRTELQRQASRANGAKSRGPTSPGGKEASKFNGLRHGLRAEQVVLPGEDPAEFEAERQAWIDDWKPLSHTRAVLVERAAVAAWRLRRAVRSEAATRARAGDDAARAFDSEQAARVGRAVDRFGDDPRAALSLLESDALGIDRLLAAWAELGAALESGPAGRDQPRYHARLMLLLGHPDGTDLLTAGPLPRASARLLRANAPAAAPLPAGEAEASVAGLRRLAAEAIGRLREHRGRAPDLSADRRRAAEAASSDATAEAQLRHRYEMALDRALRGTIYQLVALERCGADLAGRDVSDPGPAEAPPSESPPEVHLPEANTPELVASPASSAPGSVGAGGAGPIPGRAEAPSPTPTTRPRPAAAASGGGSKP